MSSAPSRPSSPPTRTPSSPSYADHLLAARTGPEALTGSTRLKAGTAQKLVLNSFSTAVMIRLGRTWSNLMVDVVATNAKLRGRVVRILQEATGADAEQARAALDEAGGELKPALLSMLAGVDAAHGPRRHRRPRRLRGARRPRRPGSRPRIAAPAPNA